MRFTTRADGDLNADRVPRAEIDARWAAVAQGPCTWLDEVHGADVVVVDEPGAACGATADAAVTAVAGAALGIWVGDCAPVALVSADGVVGAVHAGWRGVVAGVLEAAVASMRALGAGDVEAVLGPCIRAECYEFGTADLAAVEAAVGAPVRGRTSWGAPALDVPAAVRVALARAGVERVHDLGACTACDPDRRFWSHRARGEAGRQGMLVVRRGAAA